MPKINWPTVVALGITFAATLAAFYLKADPVYEIAIPLLGSVVTAIMRGMFGGGGGDGGAGGAAAGAPLIVVAFAFSVTTAGCSFLQKAGPTLLDLALDKAACAVSKRDLPTEAILRLCRVEADEAHRIIDLVSVAREAPTGLSSLADAGAPDR